MAAVFVAAMTFGFTGCVAVPKPEQNNNQTFKSDTSDKSSDMWKIMPKIPVTNASTFECEYNSRLEGMVVTNYYGTDQKVRIPDTLEGEPVVKVNLSQCEKKLTELIMPDSVCGFSLSDTIKRTLLYINIPGSMTEINGSPFKVKEYNYLIDGNIWVPGSPNLMGVYINDGVTKICERAFYGTCLKNIYIPNSVTEIEKYAFEGCDRLTSITIPDSITVINEGVFYNCSGLTDIVIPDSVTAIGKYAFHSCKSLTSINIPNSVTAIGGYAFIYCTSLTSINIPNSVTTIRDCTFHSCTNLTSVNIPDSVTTIRDNAFWECPNIIATYKGKNYDYEHIYDLYRAGNSN